MHFNLAWVLLSGMLEEGYSLVIWHTLLITCTSISHVNGVSSSWQILFTGAQVDKKASCAGKKGIGILVHLLGAQRLRDGFVPLRTSGCLQATPAGIVLKEAWKGRIRHWATLSFQQAKSVFHQQDVRVRFALHAQAQVMWKPFPTLQAPWKPNSCAESLWGCWASFSQSRDNLNTAGKRNCLVTYRIFLSIMSC